MTYSTPKNYISTSKPLIDMAATVYKNNIQSKIKLVWINYKILNIC